MTDKTESTRDLIGEALEAGRSIASDRSGGGRMLTSKEDARATVELIDRASRALSAPVETKGRYEWLSSDGWCLLAEHCDPLALIDGGYTIRLFNAAAPVEAKGPDWCPRCGCGNDALGYGHLAGCTAKGPADAWLSEYDGHTDATTDPDTVRIWRETLHRTIVPLYRAAPVEAKGTTDAVLDQAARIIHTGAFDKEAGSEHQRHEAREKAKRVLALALPAVTGGPDAAYVIRLADMIEGNLPGVKVHGSLAIPGDEARATIVAALRSYALPAPKAAGDDWHADFQERCRALSESRNGEVSGFPETAPDVKQDTPSSGDETAEQIVQRVKEACAQVADRAAEKETAIVLAAANDPALSTTGWEGIEDCALARKRLAQDLGASIRALIPAANPSGDARAAVIEARQVAFQESIAIVRRYDDCGPAMLVEKIEEAALSQAPATDGSGK